jgi:molybdopterin-synthase adenylyltransferase
MLYRAVQAKIEPVVIALTSANSEDLLWGSALVVDAFDNRAARAAVSESVRTLHYPCLHIGFSPDGLYGSGIWGPHYKVPHDTPGDPCDYPLTRPVALVLTALAARSNCDHFSKGLSNDFELTWNDLKIAYS